MEQPEHLYLVLGCFGRIEDGFISCGGIQNRILEITDKLYNYVGLLDYLDNCRLFDRPIFDYNAIRNFTSHIQDKFDQPTRKLFSAKQFQLYQKFIIDHRHCDLFIKLVLRTDEVISVPEKSISVHIEKEPEIPENEKGKLKLIRRN